MAVYSWPDTHNVLYSRTRILRTVDSGRTTKVRAYESSPKEPVDQTVQERPPWDVQGNQVTKSQAAWDTEVKITL